MKRHEFEMDGSVSDLGFIGPDGALMKCLVLLATNALDGKVGGMQVIPLPTDAAS